MTDLYDVHNARFFTQPTTEEIEASLRESFGMTDTPQTDPDTDHAAKIIAMLTVPFRRDQISQRKIGGRMLDYVEGHEYITRLNEASPAWSFRMTKSDMQPLHVTRYDKQRQPYQTDLPCLVVHGELTIPGVGTRAGIGVQMIEDNAGEDVMKGALTDCLKNCAKYFGLGLHMYSGDAPAPAESRQQPSGAPQRPARLSQVPPDHPSAQHPAQASTGGGPPATDPQKNAIRTVARKHNVDPDVWAREQGANSVDALTKPQASAILTEYGG